MNSLINAGGGLAFWSVAARTASPSTVGLAGAGFTMVILLASISQLGLGVGIVRYGASFGPQGRQRVLRIFGAVTVIACVVSGVFLRLVPHVAPSLNSMFTSRVSVVLFGAACVGWAISVLYDHYLMSRGAMDILVGKNVFVALSRIMLVVGFTSPGPVGLIAMTGLSGVVGVGVAGPLLARSSGRLKQSSSSVATSVLLKYSLWNYCVGLAGTVPALVMPTLVLSITTAEQAAAYYMTWTLFGVVLLVPSALSWTLLAAGSAHEDHYAREGTLNDTRSASLILLLTALFVPVGLIVLRVLGPTYVAHGWPVLLVLVIGVWPYHRALLLMTEMRLFGSQQVLAAVFGVSQVAVVASSVLLLNLMGAAGGAVAWTVGQFLLFMSLRRSSPSHRSEEPVLRSHR